MFSNVVRFDDESAVAHSGAEQRGATHPALGTQATVGPLKHDVGAPPGNQEAGDLAWMQGMIDQQLRLFEAAQRERAMAVAELKRIAQTLCRYAWDTRLRAGERLEEWPPTLIADLIIQSVQAELRRASLSQNLQLADKHSAVLAELAETQTELQSLRQRLQAAESHLGDMKMAEAGETKKKPDRAHRSDATQASSKRHAEEEATNKPQSVSTMSEKAHREAKVDAENSTARSGNERVDDVVRLIAQEGLCRWKDVSVRLAERWGVSPGGGAMDTAIKRAVSLDLLQAHEIRLEWGGKPTGKMLVLSDAGKRCALSLGVKPVESQYTRGIAAHKDGSHFYAILEVANILSAHYQNVDCFPSAITLENGKYFPDVAAATAQGEMIFVEVERATYKDGQDREEKWLRAAAANIGAIYLVTPNQEAMTAIVEEINQVRGRHPDHIKRLLALNVRSYRERQGTELASPWAYES
ncbi:hypothetical protein FJY94_04405 [Candidatus Kaiserbacteria bacterium]|nr:hypothetical protein [Candidatus Kaiserbacteria bacterium]